MEIFYNSTFVVAISFVLFFGLLGYLGVHKFIIKFLDERAAKIRAELDEARQLREDAQELFAEFERKQKEVSGQADDIVAHAKAEAEAAAERAKIDIAASVERRLRAADDQIALAEANAVTEVKNKAVAVAVAAAEDVLRSRLTDDTAQGLVDGAIASVGARLH